MTNVITSIDCAKDRLFDKPDLPIADFRFDASVATVFDDMVSRSVPFYSEMQRMITELAADFAEPGSCVYDLGYSNTEIEKKRASLENVLIPYRFEENRELLLNNGFGTVEEFFRWYNFSAFVAIRG